MIAVIDPGHGGIYPDDWPVRSKRGKPCTGGVYNGIVEAALMLKLGLEVEGLALEIGGIKPVMTRRTDKFLDLEERAAIAQEAGAHFTVSLHVNGHGERTDWRGMTLYYMDGEETATHAARIATRACPYQLTRRRMLWPMPFGELPKKDKWLSRPRSVLLPHSRRGIQSLLFEVAFSSNYQDSELLKNTLIFRSLADCVLSSILAAAEKIGIEWLAAEERVTDQASARAEDSDE